MSITISIDVSSKDKFIIDAGDSHHMCSDLIFRELQIFSYYKVIVGDTTQVNCSLMDEVDLILSNNKDQSEIS